jgi:hypothetical protein
VEAASPALLEKVRTATDGTGQYRILDLDAGTYTVTYSLAGFVTVKREDVQISGNVVITLNADMRVGGVQETITVTGETPVVDVQTSARERRDRQRGRRGASGLARLRQHPRHGARHSGHGSQLRAPTR